MSRVARSCAALPLFALFALTSKADELQAKTACASGTYLYTFKSACNFPIWIGQHATVGTKSYPPNGGNWAIAGACTSTAQCPSGRTCNGSADRPGQCSCRQNSDCAGGANCVGGFCATSATFCMPQTWTSGTFWPRTVCTPGASGTLTCATGQCGGGSGMLDCGVGNNGGSPQNPVTQLEVTTAPGTANYDVSINAGYNVEMRVVPRGGTPSDVNCHWAGCIRDLNATCPAALQLKSGGNVVGCLDPCTQCVRNNPTALNCATSITTDVSGHTPAKTTPCTGSTTRGSLPTYQDMYCAKNVEGDGNSQASSNQGTPTAYAQLDCPVGTIFTTQFASFKPPTGMGVCINPANPNYANSVGTCSASTVGQGCGGYLFLNYDDALGYTCQSVGYSSGGNALTAYVCVPPVTSGLAACQAPAGNTPLYQGTGGVFNAAWLTAGLQAGGGTKPYYETFKEACPQAYTWQYDDDSGGFACTTSKLTGFDVTFCDSLHRLR